MFCLISYVSFFCSVFLGFVGLKFFIPHSTASFFTSALSSAVHFKQFFKTYFFQEQSTKNANQLPIQVTRRSDMIEVLKTNTHFEHLMFSTLWTSDIFIFTPQLEFQKECCPLNKMKVKSGSQNQSISIFIKKVTEFKLTLSSDSISLLQVFARDF